MPLFNISFPSNAQFVYGLVIGISNFDILPTKKIDAYFFNFTTTESDP